MSHCLSAQITLPRTELAAESHSSLIGRKKSAIAHIADVLAQRSPPLRENGFFSLRKGHKAFGVCLGIGRFVFTVKVLSSN
jgi:hypothetical protein